MISDGNGVGTNCATRLFMGQQAGGMGDDYVMPFEEFPNLALVRTHNTNAQTSDSAGTGSAMLTGVKTPAGVVGVDQDVVRGDCSTIAGNEVTSAGEIFAEGGPAVGFVGTARVTHATPASVYAHSADRNWEDSVPEGCTDQTDIAQQLIAAMANGTVDFALGGGARHFLPQADGGRRADGQDLAAMAADDLGAHVVTDQASFEALDLSGETPVLGLFESSHMMYEADRTDEPSLAEMTSAAIENLQNAGGEDGFFLMVEAGRVDHANHAGNLARVVRDGEAFADAVATAVDMTDPTETLIIVTADHEHALAFNGYCGRGSDILGLCMEIDPGADMHAGEPNIASDGLPYTVAGYLNGAGSVLIEQEDGSYVGDRARIEGADVTDVDYVQEALVPLSSETHSGEDVAVYAHGPYAHLLEGTIEQNVIFHVMMHAASAEE